jgi:hypothetical protein
MESGMQPMSGTGIQSAMSNAGFGPINVSMGGMSSAECGEDAGEDEKFTSEDYILAKELIAQVGSADRARELLDNLSNVYDMLDIDPNSDDNQIAIIAGSTPDEVDFPSNRLF